MEETYVFRLKHFVPHLVRPFLQRGFAAITLMANRANIKNRSSILTSYFIQRCNGDDQERIY